MGPRFLRGHFFRFPFGSMAFAEAIVKHPERLDRNSKIKYEKLYRYHAGRYLVWSVSGLVGTCVVIYLLIRPHWPMAVMSIMYCSGFVLCVCSSAMLGKRRAHAQLRRERDSAKRNVSGR
jgi:hypothetical protein